MEAKVLGQFVPREWQSDAIEQGFRALECLPPCCRKERVSVRIPMGIPPMSDNLEWHQDGGGPDGTTDHMVIWSSEQPTELRDSEGHLFGIAPLEVVWFDNRKAFHRQPRGTDEHARWFVAIRCSGAL